MKPSTTEVELIFVIEDVAQATIAKTKRPNKIFSLLDIGPMESRPFSNGDIVDFFDSWREKFYR